MLKIKDILIISIVVLLTGCTSDEIATGDSRDDKGFDPVGMPVHFSVGLEGKALTRSGEVLLPDNSRFVCTMYYHSKTSDTDASDYDVTTSKIHTAWLKVSGGSGNAVYKNSDFFLVNHLPIQCGSTTTIYHIPILYLHMELYRLLLYANGITIVLTSLPCSDGCRAT